MPTITVACKYPHGLRLRLQKPIKVMEPVMGGGSKEVEYWVPDETKKEVVLNGWAFDRGGDPVEHTIAGGCGLTSDVDADFFNAWCAQNPEHPAVAGGYIFAAAKETDAVKEAKSRAKDKTGLEPIDPKNMPDEFTAVSTSTGAA